MMKSGLIDCGMNIAGAFERLSGYLEHLGHTFPQIRQIVITHHHPDHIGLSGPVKDASRGNVILHRDDAAVLPSRYGAADRLLSQVADFLDAPGRAARGNRDHEHGFHGDASLCHGCSA